MAWCIEGKEAFGESNISIYGFFRHSETSIGMFSYCDNPRRFLICARAVLETIEYWFIGQSIVNDHLHYTTQLQPLCSSWKEKYKTWRRVTEIPGQGLLGEEKQGSFENLCGFHGAAN